MTKIITNSTATLSAQRTYDALAQGTRHLNKLESLVRTAASILDPSEATDYQNAMFMLGATTQKIAEIHNIHREIDTHFRTMLKDIHEIMEIEQDAARRAAADLANKLPPVEVEKPRTATEILEQRAAVGAKNKTEGGDNAGQ